jgi:hypothetical protein
VAAFRFAPPWVHSSSALFSVIGSDDAVAVTGLVQVALGIDRAIAMIALDASNPELGPQAKSSSDPRLTTGTYGTGGAGRRIIVEIRALGKTSARIRKKMVGVIGFEPTASWSRTKRSTRLSYTPYVKAAA